MPILPYKTRLAGVALELFEPLATQSKKWVAGMEVYAGPNGSKNKGVIGFSLYRSYCVAAIAAVVSKLNNDMYSKERSEQ